MISLAYAVLYYVQYLDANIYPSFSIQYQMKAVYFVLQRSSNSPILFVQQNFLQKLLIIFCTQSSTYICKLCYLLFIRYIAHHRDSKLMIEMVSLKIIIDFRFVYFTLNSSHKNRLCVTDTNFSTVYGI